MTRLLAFSQVQQARFATGGTEGGVWQTFFLNPAPGSREPQAFLVEYRAGRALAAHFHDVDEFQLFLAGGGTLGQHAVRPVTLHFARAYTPYGPIVAGEGGLAFLTLRARRDSMGPHRLPEQRAELEAQGDRRPWQASQELPQRSGVLAVTPLPRFAHDASGLGAICIDLPAFTAMRTPPASPAGEYIVLLEGTLQQDGRELAAPVLAFLGCDDAVQQLCAGGAGARVLCLNFPEPLAMRGESASSRGQEGCWRCSLCGSVYDPSAGDAARGIAPGTPWEDLPSEWRCADCDAERSDFVRCQPAS